MKKKRILTKEEKEFNKRCKEDLKEYDRKHKENKRIFKKKIKLTLEDVASFHYAMSNDIEMVDSLLEEANRMNHKNYVKRLKKISVAMHSSITCFNDVVKIDEDKMKDLEKRFRI